MTKVLLWSIGLDLLAVLPVGLLGALGIFISRDLSAPAAAVGLLVCAYFASGAILALAAGSLIDAMGWHRAASVGLSLLTGSLGLLALARPLGAVVMASALAGAGAAMVQPATSALISNSVTSSRRALAINVKLAAAPGALFLAGLSIPAVAQPVGWRAAFGLAALLPFTALLLLQHSFSVGARAHDLPTATRARSGTARRGLRVVGLAVFLGAMVPGSVIAFMVPALLDAGFSTTSAGILFAGLNCLTILSRIAVGVIGNHALLSSFRVMGMIMLGGGAGVALMIVGQPWAVLAGGLLAFTMGFAWLAQSFAIAVRMFPGSPGAAAAVIQSGGMGGSASGPLLAAAAVGHVGVSGAWALGAAATLLGATLLMVCPPRRPAL